MKIIAEIGWNHMGDMKVARQMIESAADNGADFCKFQTWSEDNLKEGSWDNDGRREIYKKAQLTEEKHYLLKDICKENNVEFMTSIFNIVDIDFLENLNSKIIKIPSMEVYNLELIKAALNKFDIVLVSTGASKWTEIMEVVNLDNFQKIFLLHCVSTYPCHLNNINFPKMDKLKSLTNKVGYSGHFDGIDDAISAICNGAYYVEKHFTIDKKLPGRDNQFSILPQDLKRLSDFRDNYLEMYIDHGLDVQECELDSHNNYRGRWSNIT